MRLLSSRLAIRLISAKQVLIIMQSSRKILSILKIFIFNVRINFISLFGFKTTLSEYLKPRGVIEAIRYIKIQDEKLCGCFQI